jgi:anti-sigma regulatory factor (Ser/Thr protein kinase)
MKTARSKEIEDYIIENVEKHKNDICHLTSDHFGISQPAVSKHLKSLIEENIIEATGKTKARTYTLRTTINETFKIPITEKLEEDVVWRERINPLLGKIRENVRLICNHGFTEMLNNVKDHSGSGDSEIWVFVNPAYILLQIRDFGLGVFNKIKQDFNLYDQRQALLELSKGKLTSDSTKHSGEGIFFTSRMFDEFELDSDGFAYCRLKIKEDNQTKYNWVFETSKIIRGTRVRMKISQFASQTTSETFQQFAPELHNYGFTKTHIPLALAQYEGEQLVSRSQAKRVLMRIDQFQEVLLDFRDIKTIGQAFADEIFRVYQINHPNIRIIPMNANEEVNRMINHVMTSKQSEIKNLTEEVRAEDLKKEGPN